MAAQFIVDAVIVAFGKQVKVILRKRWEKTIWIVKLANRTTGVAGTESVSEGVLKAFNETFPKTIFGNALKRKTTFFGLVYTYDFTAFRAFEKSPNNQAFLSFYFNRVHAQVLMRMAMASLEERFEFLLGYDHDEFGLDSLHETHKALTGF